MDCAKVKELLGPYIDGELTPELHAEVEKHLAGCPACRDRQRAILELMGQVNNVRVGGDENFWLKQKDSILRKIEEAEAGVIVKVPRRSYRGLIFKLAAVAASLVLVTYVSIQVSRINEKTGGIFAPKRSTEVTKTAPAPNNAPEALMNVKEPSSENDTMPAAKSPMKREEQLSKGQNEFLLTPSVTGPADKDRGTPAVSKMSSDTAVSKRGVEGSKKAERKINFAPSDEMKPQSIEIVSIPAAIEKNIGAKGMTDKESEVMDSVILLQKSSDITVAAKEEKSVAAEAMPAEVQAGKLAGGAETGTLGDSLNDLNYAEWRVRVEYLQRKFMLATSSGDLGKSIINKSKAEKQKVAAKAPISESANSILMELAEAYYNLGKLSPNPSEKKSLVEALRRLSEKALPSSVPQLDKYIADLASSIK